MTKKGQHRADTAKARFLRQFRIGDGCWEWTGTFTRSGYGLFGISGTKRMTASRAAWLLFCGPIPDGLQVCHKCDNPACVRYDHLFLGTPKENIQDSVRKGRSRTGVLNSQAKITAETVRAVLESSEVAHIVAAKHGISKTQVTRIRRGESWPSVSGIAAPAVRRQGTRWRGMAVGGFLYP